MEQLFDFIIRNRDYTPWLNFGFFMLAGLSLPISIDVLLLINALLAATILPHSLIPLFLSCLLGTYFSAWIPYWLGRTVGKKLLKLKFFSAMLSEARLKRLSVFYEKHGLLTLIIGRFIPFGVRNCLFTTTGMSHMSFKKFALRDIFAASLWVTIAFFVFYSLAHNYETLRHHLKIFNIVIFSLFALAVIGFIWYKKFKRKRNS